MAGDRARRDGWRRGGPALLGLALLLAGAPGMAANLEPPPEGVDARDLAVLAENALRSERTFMEAEISIRVRHRSRPREIRFRSFDDRSGRRCFVRVLAPGKEEGTTFLELHPNLWTYAPREERTLRIPPSMMLEPWLESGFTNDDLVHASSPIDDYDHRLLGVDPKPDGIVDLRGYVVEYIPRVESPGLWGRMVTWIETEHGTPLRREFYGKDGELARVIRFGGIREVQGRYFPHVWTLQVIGEPGRETRLEVEQIRFDADFGDSVFATGNLKAPE